MMELSAAFIVGLLGGVHCLGMCGGIVTALTLGLGAEQRQRLGGLLPFLLAYNLGRISSYMLAGAMVAGLGQLLWQWAGWQASHALLQCMAALLLLLMGLYIGGWWLGLRHIEHLGGGLWRFIQPLAQRVIPMRRVSQAFIAGLLWGWLPCGLVYSMLLWSMSAPGPMEGATVMTAFGLGTLPNLLLMGGMAQQLGQWLRVLWVRRGCGLVLLLMGGWQLYLALFNQ